MSKLEKLIKDYYNHTFDDLGGYTSDDYKTFERKYKNVLKEIGEEIGLDLHNFNGNHYEFSAVMKSKTDEKYYYISISDTRYWEMSGVIVFYIELWNTTEIIVVEVITIVI